MPRFSIVVPTADRSEYLLHCLTTLGSLGDVGWKEGYIAVDCKHIPSVKTIYDASVLAAAIVGTS